MSKELFDAGEVIFQKGDRSEIAYVIESGEVEIFDGPVDDAYRIALLGAGDIFGEMGLLDEVPRSRGARAVSQVVASRMTQSDFVTLLRENPDESLRYMRLLFERLRGMNSQMVPAQEDKPASKMEQGAALRLLPDSDHTKKIIPEGGLVIKRFPYNVGRKSRDPLTRNDLSIEDEKPYTVSRDHFAFDQSQGQLLVRDRGSYLGLQVNGEHIGGDREHGAVPLESGENLIVLGCGDTTYRFKVQIEAPEAR